MQTINLDYPVAPRVRYGWGHRQHAKLAALISAGGQRYRQTIASFIPHLPKIAKIPRTTDDPISAFWQQEWFPAFDGIALYSLLATKRPKRLFEIGSGMSTKFARRASNDCGLGLDITSIDPHPRSEIDTICNSVIRQPLEAMDVDYFSMVRAGDFLFFDGSHRAFQNSDVTVFFTEILPSIPAGVTIGVHDIFLPYDYPPDWADRFYSEQYLMACWLFGGDRIKIELPVFYCAETPALRDMLEPLWKSANIASLNHSGGTLWFTKHG